MKASTDWRGQFGRVKRRDWLDNLHLTGDLAALSTMPWPILGLMAAHALWGKLFSTRTLLSPPGDFFAYQNSFFLTLLKPEVLSIVFMQFSWIIHLLKQQRLVLNTYLWNDNYRPVILGLGVHLQTGNIPCPPEA